MRSVILVIAILPSQAQRGLHFEEQARQSWKRLQIARQQNLTPQATRLQLLVICVSRVPETGVIAASQKLSYEAQEATKYCPYCRARLCDHTAYA